MSHGCLLEDVFSCTQRRQMLQKDVKPFGIHTHRALCAQLVQSNRHVLLASIDSPVCKLQLTAL